MSTIIVTEEIRQKAQFFSDFKIDEEVPLPELPMIREALSGEFLPSALTFSQLKQLIETCSYLFIPYEALVGEFMWRIGNHTSSWNQFFEYVGPISYCIWFKPARSYKRGYREEIRVTTTYQVRRNIEPVQFRDALMSMYPSHTPIIGLAHGLRCGSNIDSLDIAYWGDLRMVKWYHERGHLLGISFAQNTVNPTCLRYAQSVGIAIGELPIRTTSLECQELLVAAGAVMNRQFCIDLAIHRQDLDALQRITANHELHIRFHCWNFFALMKYNAVNFTLFQFMCANADIGTLRNNDIMTSVVKKGLPYIKFLIDECGISANEFKLTYASLEVVHYLHELGVRWVSQDIYNAMHYMRVDILEFLNTRGHVWTDQLLNSAIHFGNTNVVKYFISSGSIILTLKHMERAMNKASIYGKDVIKALHEGGCPGTQPGTVPKGAYGLTLAYIKEHIDPNYVE